MHSAVTVIAAERSPLVDACQEPWYSQGRRALLRQQPIQMSCCRLNLESCDFEERSLLCSLIVLSDPRRNHYIPLFVAFLYRAFDLSLCSLFSHIIALVVKLFALAQSKLHFHFAAFEVQR